MNNHVIVTCAVTGGDDTAGRFANVPVTPAQIASAAIDAAKAGAAIAHIHVRNPETGKPSMELALYREVVERIRDSGSDVIINLTTGPGARFVPSDDTPNAAKEGSNLRPPSERVRHIVELRPDICSLDMGSLNFGKGALINVPSHIEVIAAAIRGAGVKPELEIFDTGHLALALNMIERGLIAADPLFQIVLGVPWGAPATTETLAAMKSLLPHGAQWAAFGISRWEFPMVAQAVLLGGHVRVGIEDNLYLEKGVLAPSNAALVEKARRIVELLGASVASSAEARQILALKARSGV
ncbi:MAG TPA: 3-keto-5-aminohexanoate cleavage protein [Xanthobacteraceae bacterium]|nr:3-keto-5-aminohexanoate cleavage protein [Xanthobacteraceae bacterium]